MKILILSDNLIIILSDVLTWNRLAKAVSFSMYFLYSSIVVAPMHLKALRGDRWRRGLRMKG